MKNISLNSIVTLMILSFFFLVPLQQSWTRVIKRDAAIHNRGTNSLTQSGLEEWAVKCRRTGSDGATKEWDDVLSIQRSADGRLNVALFQGGGNSDFWLKRIGPNEYSGEWGEANSWHTKQTVKIENGQITHTEIQTNKESGYEQWWSKDECTGYKRKYGTEEQPDHRQKEETKGSALGYNNCFPASSYNPNDIPDESISSRYDEVKPFSEGLAAVGKTPPGMRNAKWGFIDRSGRLIIDLRYDVVTPFSGGLAGVGNFVGQERSAKWGIINSRGIMLPAGQVYPSHDAMKILGEGFAAIGDIPRSSRSAKWYIINAQGIRFLRLPLFDFVDCFVGGRSRASYSDSVGNTHTGYVDTTGRFYEDPKRR
jgi:WG containing repeat